MTMNGQDRQRFVQQYVERQRAYIPTYTTEDVVGEATKLPQSNLRFGFDTPVLRPRTLVKPSKRGAELADDARDPVKGDKDKPRNKCRKATTPDNEHAVRLADRRERRRKKRAIVDPPPKDDEENVRTVAAKKGKAKQPAELALLYGFSATNVTKDRLTLRSAPSLGVFSKGKASVKKRVTTKKSSSRNELFSESAFLNKSSERIADTSKSDDDSDDSSMSIPRAAHTTNRTKSKQGRCAKTPALNKQSGTPTRTAAESEIWDIEIQSKLPSSACGVSSEPETKESAPVILNLRDAEWSASVNVTEEYEKRRNRAQTWSLSVIQGQSRTGPIVHGSSQAGSDLGDEPLVPHAADVSSLHPSHSASQVGCRVADLQATDLRPLRPVTSKYFIEPNPGLDQMFTANPGPITRLKDAIDVPDVESENFRDAKPDVQTMDRGASPRNSLISVPLGIPTWYNLAPHGFVGNDCPCEGCWRGANVPSELGVGSNIGYFESAVTETQGDRCITDDVDQRGDIWGWHPLVGEPEGCDLMVPEYVDDIEGADPRDSCMGETDIDESICWTEDEADFLEGRALLRGVEGAGWVGPSGLDEAERDVVSQLRFHWRPLRW